MAAQFPSQTATSAAGPSAGLPPGSDPAGLPAGIPAGLRESMPLPAGGSPAQSVLAGSGMNAAATLEAGSLAEQPFLNLLPVMVRLPVDLQVLIPVRAFRVRNLLAMGPGEIIESSWANGEDLPLSSGEVQLAWSEFEVVDNRLAVRVTRLA
jgi:flagellar motor switch/type III secretory pathway protein FliN